jgi:hypothetical protein
MQERGGAKSRKGSNATEVGGKGGSKEEEQTAG